MKVFHKGLLINLHKILSTKYHPQVYVRGVKGWNRDPPPQPRFRWHKEFHFPYFCNSTSVCVWFFLMADPHPASPGVLLYFSEASQSLCLGN